MLTNFNLQSLYSNSNLLNTNIDNDENEFPKSLSEKQRELYYNYRNTRNLINKFCDDHFEFSNNKDNDFKWDMFLNAEDIFVNIFRREILSNSVFSNNIVTDANADPNKVKHIEVDFPNDDNKHDVNLESFQSNLNFVTNLCDICERVGSVPNHEQMAFLRKEIHEINKLLPSNLYIPFLKDSIRNYIICHIPVTEMRIFRTKNRAPFMITVEAVRIDEIINDVIKMAKRGGRDTSNVNNSVNDGQKYMKFNKDVRSRSFSMSNSESKNELFIAKNDTVKSFAGKTDTKTRKATDIDIIRNRGSSIMKMLAESDIQLSKPVIISNLEAENKKTTPLRGEKKIILEEKAEYEESFVKDDMDELVKRKMTAYPIRPSTIKDKEKEKVDDIIINKKVNFDDKVTTSNKNSDEKSITEPDIDITNDELIITIKNKPRNYTTHELNAPKLSNKMVDEDNYDDENDKDDKDNEDSNTNTNADEHKSYNPSMSVEFEDIFGELFEEQSMRIKSTSPFGKLSTWKLFKMIIKSGEDLRQEQFATQLINEFYQIFQLEKVDCWLNTYEIIATGNDVGIIECVPNAISIDQLKKKIRGNSLRNFFENYFGPTDSKSNKIFY